MVVSSLDGILSGNNTKVFFGQVGSYSAHPNR